MPSGRFSSPAVRLLARAAGGIFMCGRDSVKDGLARRERVRGCVRRISFMEASSSERGW